MKKFLIKLTYFLPLAAALIMTEYSISSFTFFNKTETTIATALLSGKNVAFSFDYDDRMVQKYVSAATQDKKDWLILGSSRSAKIDEHFFPHQTFYNANVTGADLEDYIAIYQLYRVRGLAPHTIIIGLDPWIMAKNGDPARRWLSLGREFYQLAGSFPFSQDPAALFWYAGERFKNIFFLSHFQFSIKKMAQNQLANNYSQSQKYYVTDETEGFMPIVHHDGSIAESLKIRSRSTSEVTLAIKKSTAPCPANLDQLLSPEKEFLLKYFLQTLQRDQVKVIFWLAPFHPLTYHEITTDRQCHLAIEAEEYLRQLAKNEQIRIVGSYDPAQYHLGEEYFYDSTHPKRTAIADIFQHDGLTK